MAELIVEIIGWIGMIIVLLAYFLITWKKIDRESKVYHSMNLFGAFLLGINSFINKAYPPTGLDIAWMLIAIYGLAKGAKLFKKKK